MSVLTMKTISWMAALVAASTFVTLSACSSDDPEQPHDDDHKHDEDPDHDHDLPASCEAFHEACILAEDASAEAKACHDFVHQEGLTEEQCAAKKSECQTVCVPKEDDPHDDDHDDHNDDAGTCADKGGHCSENSDCCSNDCHDDHCH